jgi:uncharacterized protein (DUF2252 family)
VARDAMKAFGRYANMLHDEYETKRHHLDVVDVALRIAGTGSVGGLRVAVLVRGGGGRDGGYIFDMKEQGTPSAAVIVKPPKHEPAARVITAIETCSKAPPTLLGETKLGKSSMFVRKLMPQEDKLDFSKLEPHEILPLGRYLGALVGKAHARGAKKMPKRPWKQSDREHVMSSAIELAGLHEGAYLALAEALRTEKEGHPH